MASSPPSTRTVIENVSVVDGGALQCSACYSPLKPPVFQCDVGHLVCSSCSEKMAGARRCHTCRRVLDGGGYPPCYGVDRILGCLQVPCPNAGYGCSVRLARHDQRARLLQACQHGPCHCPAEACAFVGSVTALWDHFSAAHGWPCTTAVLTGGDNGVHLRDGFSVVNLVRGDGSYLLLLRGFPDQRAVSTVCFHRSMH